MSVDTEAISSELVINQLRKSGLIGPLQAVDLQPLARNPGRLDHDTRRAFRVWAGQRSVCYLLAGPQLSKIAQRAREFAEACPDIATKVLFYQENPRADLLGMEFVEGSVLDESAAPSSVAGEAIAAIVASLERSTKPSTLGELRAELDEFFGWVLACPIFGVIDGGFLRDAIFPWVRDGACSQPAHTRWTNGDFTSHNVIIDRTGLPRLIDYEYARRTHFHLEDFVRWRAFSSAERHYFDSRIGNLQPWLEAYFLLRQTVLDHRVASPKLALAGAEERLRRLRELAATANLQFQNSFFLRPLTMRLEAAVADQQKQIHELDAEVVKRGEWGTALTQSLRDAEARIQKQQRQIQDLDAEVVKRGEWGTALTQSLRDAEARIQEQQKQIQDLDAEAVKRGEWGTALTQSLRDAEARADEAQDLAREHATREARIGENFRNLEEQMAQAQSLTADLTSEVERLARETTSLEAMIEQERNHRAVASEDERRQRALLEDKVGRMQQSLSWRATSPLRTLRRLFLDRK